MELALLGLGRMGLNMATRLARGGHRVVAWNRTTQKALDLAREEANIEAIQAVDALRTSLTAPRVVWLMLPAGQTTEEMIDTLLDLLEPGDIIIDGGNSNFHDTMRRARKIADRGLHMADVGTSGGIWGLTEGYSLMIGAEKPVAEFLRPIFETLAPGADKGWGHMGPNGAGHFVKMVHNGIEYGMMQAFAEGFEVMKARKEFGLDLHQIAETWRYGSVVRSWLLDLIARGLEDDQDLAAIKGWVADSGEGRWTVFEAIDQDVPAPVITLSLLMRFVSRQDESYGAKLLAMMRNQFGGHEVKRSSND